ncbi:DUF2958 domain-containing protein [Sphingobium yanoikuyae]|uniref:DUF2958 domain-containing protein n=1 Tax=Sphingobium yanoikuyae TaxID=13690 RepID=UPI003B9013DA
MILLPPDIRRALRANAISCAAAKAQEKPFDPCCEARHSLRPIAKFFNPLGAATWLATELYEDGDTLFGLADLGFGCPEIGVFSLREIERIRLPYGMRIERDEGFHSPHSLSRWASTARRAGSIIHAEQLLIRAGPDAAPDLPTDPVQGAAG